MALVGKTRFQANVGDRQAREEKASGAVDAPLYDIGVGGQAHGCAEHAEEMEGAQTGQAGKVMKRDVLGEMMVEILEEQPDDPSFDIL
jgi:hypothetical protein